MRMAKITYRNYHNGSNRRIAKIHTETIIMEVTGGWRKLHTENIVIELK
jgi:hypothetical protein